MEFCNLKVQYRLYQTEIENAIRSVIDSAAFVNGPDVSALEAELSAFCGARHVLACANGTDALYVPLLALGVRPGDEVIVPDFTFIATAEMVALAGATPVFADIDPVSYNIDPDDILSKITPRTVGIIPVSLYGQCADFERIGRIAEEHGLWVMEDAAQSFGARFREKRSCSFTRLATTSFFPSKPLGCFGDGGAIFTSDDELSQKMRTILNHGQIKRYHHAVVGVNSRLDTIQAAVLRVKLRHFEEEIAMRDQIARGYTARLAGLFATPVIGEGHASVWAQYTIRVSDREKVQQHLQSQGIPTAVHYPIPLHAQEAFRHLGTPDNSCPHAFHASREVLSLPMHPFLTEGELDRVCFALQEAL